VGFGGVYSFLDSESPGPRKRTTVEREHNVAEKVVRRQAGAYARRTWETRGKVFSAVADAQPRSLREDPCREKSADGWQEGITRRRTRTGQKRRVGVLAAKP
jgi:hypothetical protein